MARVFPSLWATAFTAATTFFSALFRACSAPSSASLTAATRVPAQVLESLAVNSEPDLLYVNIEIAGLHVLYLAILVEVLAKYLNTSYPGSAAHSATISESFLSVTHWRWNLPHFSKCSRPYASSSYEHCSMPQFGDAVFYVTGLTSLSKTWAGDVRGFLQQV